MKFGILCMVFWFCCGSAWAAPTASLTESSLGNELLFAGTQTVVTAARSKQPLNQAPAAVTVITADQLERYGVVTLPDALRYVAGMNVSEAGANIYNITLRGFNSQYANSLLIMIDNRPINEQFTGGLFWETLPVLLTQIDRIEIVRGPGSALYGADAYNGVINIITKAPDALTTTRSNLSFRTVLGGYKSDYDELLASGKDDHGNAFAFGFGYNHTGGFGTAGATGMLDNYAVTLLTFDGEHKLAQGRLRLQADYAQSAENLFQVLYLTGSHLISSSVSLRYEQPDVQDPLMARMSYTNFKLTSMSTTPDETHTFEGEVQKQNHLGNRHTLVYGLSWSHTVLHSDISYPGEHYQDVFGAYFQDEWQLPQRWIGYLGFRIDDATLLGTSFSPRISILKNLGNRQTLRFAYGTSYQSPPLVNSYIDTAFPLAPGLTASALGNPKLKSITLDGFELDWRQELSKGYVQINSYYNSISNIIGPIPTAFQPSPPYPPGTPATLSYVNLSDATSYGLEVDSALKLARNLDAHFNYAYNYEHLQNVAIAGAFAPNHMLNMAFDADLGRRWEAFLGAHLVGTTSVNSNGVITSAPAYINMDIRLGYRLREGKEPLTLALVVHNLFADHHIELPPPPTNGLPAQVTPLRTVVYITLSGKF
ncbi:TonB-dependent receptor plug domain-containing protein [Chthonomonas calidirosea]|uniref:TonB-dependent receptor plug domain-containing protein n=1 Tax=Chthonomonas calidirosea TaxID=454171 RepID=UPI0006ECAA20|nr:TonB-dependent receptor [Chthonomonas calidirosea]CEK20116.1 outer membrane cobalamin receptor protein [Chthonomonas calidirosea]